MQLSNRMRQPFMCKYVLSKKSAEQHARYAICVSNTRKYVYMHELLREGRAGR